MRLIYLGTPQFAVPTLEALIAAGHDVIEVVSQPDRPKGRVHAVAMPPVKECAMRHGIPVFQPERIRRAEAVTHLHGLRPEIMVVVGYGQIIPQSVIDIAARGIINVHASLLPRLRGAAPIQWALANGDAETGVTTMRIDAGLDTGAILLQDATAIGVEENAIELADRLSHMGASLAVLTLQELEQNRIEAVAQQDADATLAPLLTKDDGRISWQWPADRIHNRVRGMLPWPGAHTLFRGHSLHVWSAARSKLDLGATAGALHVTRDGVYACGGDGRWVELREVQMEGRKRLGAMEFARGQRVENGEKLG